MPDSLPENLILPLGEAPTMASFHLTLVKPSRFLMGSNDEKARENEKPVHEIYFEEPFYIGTFPVTQAQWAAIIPDHKPSSFQGLNLPVERVSWHDIVDGSQKGGPPEAFLARVNRQLANAPSWAGWAFRLPTEAEWEYAAKGGHLAPQVFVEAASTAELYSEYAGGDEIEKVGWHGESFEGSTHPVGRKQANLLGLYDLSGNVWEWCADAYDGNIYEERVGEAQITSPVVEPTETRPYRVLRGGSWIYSAQYCRVSLRFNGGPVRRHYGIGFRLVLALVRASE